MDDKIRLQAVDTWFDPLDMFRQIAPHGIVNKEIMNRKVDMSDALDAGPNRDGVKIAQEHNQADEKQNGERGPADVASEDVSNSGAQPVHDFNSFGACPFAAQNSVGSDNAIPPGHPDTLAQNSTEQVPRSIYSSAVSGDIEDVIKVAKSSNFVDESVTTGTYDAVDKHPERPADQVHSHPKNIEESVKPSAGEAVAAPVDSEETRETHQEMSNITPDECPTIMNRE